MDNLKLLQSQIEAIINYGLRCDLQILAAYIMSSTRIIIPLFFLGVLVGCSTPAPTAEKVLLNNGFVRRADLDSTCSMSEGCTVYANTSGDIKAETYPTGAIYLTINSGENLISTPQMATVKNVIKPLFGKGVESWVSDHLDAAVKHFQSSVVDGYIIFLTVISSGGNMKTMIVIGHKNVGTPTQPL